MAYKSYIKKSSQSEHEYTVDKAIIEILNKGGLSQPKIQSILEKAPYKNRIKKRKKDGEYENSPLSRMGLWKILNKLEKKGEIEKIVLDGNLGYQVSPKSKILAQIQGDFFQSRFKNRMMVNEKKLLREFQSAKHKRNLIDSLMQFFGFYVLGSLLISHAIQKEKNMTNKQFEDFRQEWLKPVLDLQRGNPISNYFDKLIGTNPKICDEIVFLLSKEYKLNMYVLGNCAKEMVQNDLKLKDMFEGSFSKEMIDFVNERNKK